MPTRILISVLLFVCFGCFSNPAHAQMYCRETVTDSDYNLQVSVCVTDARRDLIVHVRNLDKRRKEIAFPACSVDLTSVGGGRHRSGRVLLQVYESRPNNRHVIAPHIPAEVANGFRALDPNFIQCMYSAKILEQQTQVRSR